MADLHPTMAVLSPDLAVESLEQTHERFLAFFHRIKQNLMPPGCVSGLSGRDRSIVGQLATMCFERRTRQAGLNRIPGKDKKDLLDLARSGGRLLGPATLEEVDQLAARLHGESPWMVDVTRFIMRHMRGYVRSGGGGLHLPPIILAGPPGIGKSWFARSIAEAVALPNRVIDVGAGSAAFRAVGTEKGWSSVQPGLPIETMLQSHVANPLMIVDEVDKAGVITSSKGTSSSLVTALLGLLDPGTASRFECPAMRIQFDMSRVIWILTANDVDCIPAPLRDRCRVFHMSHLSVEAALAFFDRMARSISGADGLKATARGFVATQAGCSKISLRQISRLIDTLRSGDDDGLIH